MELIFHSRCSLSVRPLTLDVRSTSVTCTFVFAHVMFFADVDKH